jgi:ABC-type glycerol-3-phosphate transport system permease component
MIPAKARRPDAFVDFQDVLRRYASPAAVHAVLLVLSMLAVIPFIWMFFASFRPFRELVESRGDFLPHVWTLQNYREILIRVNFVAAFGNSIISAVSVTAVSVLTSAIVGFVFAKYVFWGKEALFTVILATMMVPFAVVLVPLYITIVGFQLHNNIAGIIVTGFWSTFGIFMLRQFMETIPNEMLDAARIDGATEWRIFFTIIIPLSGAPMAALTIFNFLGNWDSFLWPLVVLNSPDKQTIPLVLAGLRSLYWTRYDMWSAGSMLTVVPIMILYGFASKYMIKGIAMSGMKM